MRPPVPARVVAGADGRATVELAAGEDAVAPGQACVFYERDGTRVLGGGWITATTSARAAA
jgi:tRNA-specific 2-thiouridylase